jgi:hypothetical protein
MKKLIVLTLFISSFSFGQRAFSYEQWYNDVVKTRIKTLINDSLSANGIQGTVSTNWNTAYSRSTLFVADSTNWNTAYTRSGLFVSDSTNWNTAYTRSGLLVADSTNWNLAYTDYSITTTGVDSFSTTDALDSVTLAGTGYGHFSQARVWQINPPWSADVDTAIYSATVFFNGAGNPRLLVTRVKSYNTAAATAVKSGSQYFYEVKK